MRDKWLKCNEARKNHNNIKINIINTNKSKQKNIQQIWLKTFCQGCHLLKNFKYKITIGKEIYKICKEKLSLKRKTFLSSVATYKKCYAKHFIILMCYYELVSKQKAFNKV